MDSGSYSTFKIFCGNILYVGACSNFYGMMKGYIFLKHKICIRKSGIWTLLDKNCKLNVLEMFRRLNVFKAERLKTERVLLTRVIYAPCAPFSRVLGALFVGL